MDIIIEIAKVVGCTGIIVGLYLLMGWIISRGGHPDGY